MFGRTPSAAGPAWICYACILNGSNVLEGRRLLSFQLLGGGVAEVFGSIGSLAGGKTTWTEEGTALTIGNREYVVNDCTKDFLKITDPRDNTAYLFIAQQAKSYSPF